MRARTATELACVAVAVLAIAGCPGRKAAPNLTFGLDAAAHEPFFPIAAGRHALGQAAEDGAIACSSCHADPQASFAEFSCVGCHEHRQEQMDGVHAGLSLYRFESPSCLGCHPRGAVDSAIDDATHTVQYFPIDDPSAHAAITCSGCHVNETDRSVVGCTGCHDHDPTPMQTAHGQMTGYVWETASCLGCHARSENPGAYDHTGFPTAAGQKHEVVTCKECHATPQDRTQLACTTCHEHEQPAMAEAHAAVPDYLYESGSCILCHRTAQVPGTLNHVFFPIDPPATHALGTLVDNQGFGANETISCASCHTDPEARTTVACIRCHAHSEEVLATSHTGIEGYQWQDASCLFCHPNGDPSPAINHTQFPIAAGTVHEPVACTACHASQQNRALLACTTCHEHRLEVMEPVHHGMPGWTFDSSACFTCHQQAQLPGTFDHEPLFPLAAPSGNGGHAGLSCRDCHENPLLRTELSCTTCHVTLDGETNEVHAEPRLQAAHQGIPNYVWSPASCVACHPTGTAAGAVFNHTYFPIAAGTTHEVGGGTNNLSCVDCHTNPDDYTVLGCTGCHLGTHDETPMNATHADVPGFTWQTSQCLFCHPNGEAVGNIDHEAFFPIASPAAHTGIACTSCHIDPANNQTLGCAQCHADDSPTIAVVHNGIPDFANASPACLACHPRAEPTGTMDHLAFFPISAGTQHQGQLCTGCHDSRADRSQNACASCHATVPPAPATAHGQVADFTNTSPNCKLCHAESQVDRKAAHLPFKISTGGVSDHRNAECRECHTTLRLDKPWARNFGQWTCQACHSVTQMNNRHLGDVNGYIAYDNPRCTTCHPDGKN